MCFAEVFILLGLPGALMESVVGTGFTESEDSKAKCEIEMCGGTEKARSASGPKEMTAKCSIRSASGQAGAQYIASLQRI